MLRKFNTPQKNNETVQGYSTADRTTRCVKADKKENGISNVGDQRSNQTYHKDNERKRGE